MGFEVEGDIGKFRDIDGVGSGGGDIGAGEVTRICFAGSKDFGNNDLMGKLKSCRIIGKSGAGTAESMGLYDGPNSVIWIFFFTA